jgi:N-methylhydantoinase B
MLKKLSELSGVVFDGIKRPYVPPKSLSIKGGLKLHRDWDTEIDPVTYEVIRHNLWNINEEHGSTIQRISGSPVAVYAIDLNPSILTEDAEFVYFGPFMQYMSGVTDTQVKWTMEFRSENPGIRDGDMFIANDPWVGAAHQSDVMLLCPVFVGDELFCWVTNCLHQYDVGGTTPGSFCVSARDAFDEGILLPPTRIVENYELRADIEAIYLRASRRPDMVALDLRAQIAGNVAARARVLKLVERYGAKVVKGVMKRVIENSEKSFLAKMATLPDGVWEERTYVECAYVGDRNVYPVVTRLRKQGTQLTFENDGTAPQMGAMNATYSGWRGSVMVVLNQVLCWDQYFAIGGALRHVTFDPTPGTFTCADFPASVSTAPIQAMEIALYPVYNVLAKMVYPNPKLRPDILCMSGSSQMPITQYRGIDQHGDSYGYGMIDVLAGGIGAFAVGDGISTGGQSRTPISRIPNVEFTEYQFPLLYLYRKEIIDSGGAGEYRGGLSGVSCWVAHHVEQITHEPLASGIAVPSSLGMMGGYPSTTNRFEFVRDSNVRELLASSTLPADVSDLKGEVVQLGMREPAFTQSQHDAMGVIWCGGGGFGDPLKRDVKKIAEDLENGNITVATAETVHGAVVDAKSMTIDAEATERRRAGIRKDRLARLGGKAASRREGKQVFEATRSVSVRRDARDAFFACTDCGTELGGIGENYKLGCLFEHRPITVANPNILEPSIHVDTQVTFRSFYCPGCGTLMDSEVVVDDRPPTHDVNPQVPLAR